VPGENGIRRSKDLRAEIGKFPNSTNERKKMSKKTNFKRIALVAVASLGIGVLTSVSPAFATGGFKIEANGPDASADSLGLINSRDVASASSSTNVAGGTDNDVPAASLTAVATLTAGGRLAITTAGSHTVNPVIRVTGGRITAGTAASTLNTAGTVISGPTTTAITAVITPSITTGVMTVEVWDSNTVYAAGGDAESLLTVSIVAGGLQGVFAPTSSTNDFSAQAYGSTTTYAKVDAADSLNVDQTETGATITFKAFDAYGVDLPLALITCTGTGAVVTAVGSQSAANFLSSTSSALQSTGVGYCSIKRAVANTAVSSVVTVSVNGVVFGSRSFTFVGEAASIAVTSVKAQKAEAAAKTDSFAFTVKDSAGNLLSGATVTQDSARYNASVTTATAGTTAAYNAADATTAGWTCSTTAGTANLRLRTFKADGVTAVFSPDFVAACYGDPDSYTASFDKASYVPGDIATLTISAKDSKGNPTHSYAVLGGSGNDVSIAGSNMTAVVTPTNTDKFSGGIKTYKFIVGATEGSYNAVVNLPVWNYSGGPQALTVPYVIKASTATVSNADVLKSIVALIASINKQIQALQKLILKR
jgi:trimeric autotransporter adhesin